MEAEQRMVDFEPQNLANTAWAFATVAQRDVDGYESTKTASKTATKTAKTATHKI